MRGEARGVRPPGRATERRGQPVNEPIDAINWVRWLFYLFAGIPLMAWLLFTQDRVLRLCAVLAFLLFFQDNIVGRRYIVGGLTLAPSTALAYVALVAEVLAQRRLPTFGSYLPLWFGFVFFAASNIIVGALGTGLWGVNWKYFQIFYLEGFLIFAYGMMALRTDRDLIRYTRYLMVLGLGVALVHVFTIVTGFRFRNAIEEFSGVYYAGVLDNANSLGSLYAMWIPVALSLAVGPRQSAVWRFATIAAIVGMSASLILSASRGGLLFAILTSILAFGTSRVGMARAVVATVLAGFAAVIGFYGLTTFAPDVMREIIGLVSDQGGRTERFRLFARYLAMIADNPFGIGIAPANFDRRIAEYGIPGVVSAHNIYLDIALQSGILGLAMFLGIVGSVVMQNRRAAARALQPAQRDALVYLFLPIVGFLGVGFFEPIFSISNKLNNLLWIACGVSVAASQRVFAARRAAAEGDAPDLFAPPTPLRQS